MTRCNPSKPCGQESGCARRTVDEPDAIDATVCINARQRWCPMFIDRRAFAPPTPARAFSRAQENVNGTALVREAA